MLPPLIPAFRAELRPAEDRRLNADLDHDC